MSNQTRGHCQCCGRQQAVVKSGHMSNHGYKVEWSTFIGTCPGKHYKPLELDRTELDNTCRLIGIKIIELQAFIESLSDGSYTPDEVHDRYLGKGKWRTIPWADATDYQHRAEISRLKSDAKNQIRQGEQIVRDLRDLADQVHGKQLIIVKKQPPARIQLGERRIMETSRGDYTVEVTDVQGQRVYVRYIDHPNLRTTWIGNTAFRKMEKAS